MVIIKADILPEKEEIHNEMALLLERVSLSSKVLLDNLKFHAKLDHALVDYLLPT